MQNNNVRNGKEKRPTTIRLFNVPATEELKTKLALKYREWCSTVPIDESASKTAHYLHIFEDYTKDIVLPQTEN